LLADEHEDERRRDNVTNKVVTDIPQLAVGPDVRGR
jgi:hypothetical protein